MRQLSPKGMMLLGFLLLVVGFAVPFLMMIQVLALSFLLSFLAYMASFIGLIMGLIGTALHIRERQY